MNLLFFLCAGGLAALTAALVLRAGAKAPGGVDEAKARHAATLASIESDRAAGVLNDDEAAKLKTDAARRLIDSAGASDRPRRAALAPTIGAVAIGFLALALYAAVGTPGAPDAPWSSRVTTARAAVDAGAAMSLPISERLVLLKANAAEAAPTDAAPWTRLGRAYLASGRSSEAADAFLRAIEAAGENSTRLSDLAAALMFEESNPDAERRAADLLARALELDENNVSALELAGFLALRRGELAQAELALQFALEAAPDGPRAADIRRALEAVRTRMAEAEAG